MRLNLLQTEKKQLFSTLGAIATELRGIRVALELLALKERATPLQDEPDDAAFVAQTDEDFAELEEMSRGRGSLPDDDVYDDTGPPQPPKEEPPRDRPGTGSFLPRFGS